MPADADTSADQDSRHELKDYGLGMACAQEMAGAMVEQILEEGGQTLLLKYTQRKAYPFSVDTAVETLERDLDMCFVQHTQKDNPKDWALDVEPKTMSNDAWSSFQVQPRPDVLSRQAKLAAEAIGKKAGSKWKDALRRHTMMGRLDSERKEKQLHSNDLLGTLREEKDRRAEARHFSIKDDADADEEEDKFRAAKARRDLRRVEEAQAEILEQQAEEAKRRKALTEAEEQRGAKPFTFDSYGNKMLVNQPQVEDLPGLQDSFNYYISKAKETLRNRAKTIVNNSGTSALDALGTSNPRSLQRSRSQGAVPSTQSNSSSPISSKKKKGKDPEVFSDYFQKLKYQQPPIIETIECQPGVRLECQGKVKTGPPSSDRMTRAQYLEKFGQGDRSKKTKDHEDGSRPSSLVGSPKSPFARNSIAVAAPVAKGRPASAAESRASVGASPRSQPGSHKQTVHTLASLGLDSTSLPVQAPRLEVEAVETLGVTEGAASGGGAMALRVVKMVQRPQSAIPALQPDGDSDTDANGKAPLAPSLKTRGRKDQSLGVARAWQPRQRQPLLGAPICFPHGPVQPPLGAVMGHGMIHDAERNLNFYFPGDANVPRSMSDSQLRASSAGRNRPRSSPGSRRAPVGGSRRMA